MEGVPAGQKKNKGFTRVPRPQPSTSPPADGLTTGDTESQAFLALQLAGPRGPAPGSQPRPPTPGLALSPPGRGPASLGSPLPPPRPPGLHARPRPLPTHLPPHLAAGPSTSRLAPSSPGRGPLHTPPRPLLTRPRALHTRRRLARHQASPPPRRASPPPTLPVIPRSRPPTDRLLTRPEDRAYGSNGKDLLRRGRCQRTGKGETTAFGAPPSPNPAAIFLRLRELTDHVAAGGGAGRRVATPPSGRGRPRRLRGARARARDGCGAASANHRAQPPPGPSPWPPTGCIFDKRRGAVFSSSLVSLLL